MADLAKAMEKGEVVWVEAHKLEGGCVQDLNVKAIFHSGRADFVCLANADAAFHSAARHPHRETV